jgi:chlorobactene glucosyltransferase
MIRYLTNDLLIHLIIFQSVILLFILSNVLLTIQARRHSPPTKFPKVSILIPARNEERAIADCVESLLRQDYPDFEVLVLDDQSTDNTRNILTYLRKDHPDLTILDGESSLEHQPGKNWACTQLARKARGDLLLFTDADTIHKPQALTQAVIAMVSEKADLVTGYPKQTLGSWGERLLVPFFSWAVFSFFPLGIAYRLDSAMLTSAVGQMMLFKQEAYLAIGGHSAVNLSVVDDLALARNIHKHQYRWRVIYIADMISCRMYQNSRDALNGFTKNLFAAFEFRLVPYLFTFTWLAIMFIEPLIILILKVAGKAPLSQISSIMACLGLSLLLWLIPYLYLRVPAWLALFYPATVISNEIAAIRSLWTSLTGDLVWKGRKIQRPNWKWF